MSKKSKKVILLEIMKTILNEYKEVSHKVDVTKCSLCIKYMINNACNDCPMVVFDGYSPYSKYQCLSRKCEPVDCTFMSPNDIDLLRVIKFYELAIAKIESMSVNAIRKSSFKFLVRIDKEVQV